MIAELAKLFFVFFKVGLFSFGGGYAMISTIQNEVLSHGWLTAAQYAQIVTISQITPGPLAVNTATYVGASVMSGGFLMRLAGSVVATCGVCLPEIVIASLTIHFLQKFKQSQTLQWVMMGVRAAVIGFLLSAVLNFAELAFVKAEAFSLAGGLQAVCAQISFPAVLIGIVSFLLCHKFHRGPVFIILLSAAAGLLLL